MPPHQPDRLTDLGDDLLDFSAHGTSVQFAGMGFSAAVPKTQQSRRNSQDGAAKGPLLASSAQRLKRRPAGSIEGPTLVQRAGSGMTALSDAGSKPSNSRAKKSGAMLINWSIAAASTIISYLIIEAFVFRMFFPIADASVRPHLPETPGVLAQSTKAAFVPHDSIAILRH